MDKLNKYESDKYGVPLPETSKKLKWDKNTYFIWAKLNKTQDYKIFQRVCTNKVGNHGIIVKYRLPDNFDTKHSIEEFEEVIYAPSLHQLITELMKLLNCEVCGAIEFRSDIPHAEQVARILIDCRYGK